MVFNATFNNISVIL